MNHKAFITSILICLITLGKAQNKTGLIIYDIKYPNENLKAKTVESRLFFNDTLSIGIAYSTKFYVQKNVGINQEPQGLGVTFNYGDEIGEVIYRNFKREKIILRFPKSAALDQFTVQDTWIKIQWEIKNETRQIGKFICKKAIGNFRGRTYLAWFTEEIPLPCGPYKLYGLPGLIIEAEDSEKMFLAKMKHIEYPTIQAFDVNEPIEKESKTLKEYVYTLDHMEELFLEKLNSKAPKGVRFSKNPDKKDIMRIYKTEKVFEWDQR